MGITTLNNTITLVNRILDTKQSTVPIIETKPQKPAFKASQIQQPFERVTPESQNIPSEKIEAFIKKIVQDKTVKLHNLMILRNGKVVCETSFGEQNLNTWKCTFSVCKSITSLAIGILIDEGKLQLDDKVIDLFPQYATPVNRLLNKGLTVRHLLTMTSTVLFNEAESMTETDWIKSFQSSITRGDVGKTFNYNSLNTYMLSAIVHEVTGDGLTEYLEERLFQLLGITNIFWEKCPNGIEKGGWGLYILPEDLAKIGQLVLQDGVWNGRQIVSKDWITQATTAHITVPEGYGSFNYGYQIWVGRDQNTFLFNGLFGQNVLGFRDSNILLVTNAGNDELFQQSNFFTYANECFADFSDNRLQENPSAYSCLKEYLSSLKPLQHPIKTKKSWLRRRSTDQTTPLPRECYTLCAKSLCAQEEEAASIGLLPLGLQAFQNNYTKGLQKIAFTIHDDKFFMDYHENDEVYHLAIGFDHAEYTELTFHGEPYLISARGKFATDEDDRLVLKLQLDFLETPYSRIIKLFFVDDEVSLEQSEFPGHEFTIQSLYTMKEIFQKKPVIGHAITRFDNGYLLYKIEKVIIPKIGLELKEKEEIIA